MTESTPIPRPLQDPPAGRARSASPPTPRLRLDQVCKTYPGSPPLTVLTRVSLEVMPGEDLALVGPSGSGKTTLLSIMSSLDRPTAGEVWIDGLKLADLGPADQARLRAESIGFVFQQFHLLPTLTAWENVAEGMLYSGWRRRRRREAAMTALERVGLTARADHRPSQLSGGEQQRVALARAIAGEPRLVFADEPTGALDQAAGRRVADDLRAIAASGTTVIVVTHNQELADRFSRRLSLLDGRLVADERRPDDGGRPVAAAEPGGGDPGGGGRPGGERRPDDG